MIGLADTVAALGHLRTSYGSVPRAERRRLLRRAARCPIETARVAFDYHELLLFVAAFPDDAAMLELVRRELRRVATAVRVLYEKGRRRDASLLQDSGIANTVSVVQLSVQGSNWLAARFPRDSEIAWDEGSAGDGLDTMLSAVLEPIEMDGTVDTSLSTEQWFRLARGRTRGGKSDLRWLLEHFARLGIPPRVHEKVFELLELSIRWRLRDPIASRTFSRIGRCRIHYQRTPLERTSPCAPVVAEPVPSPRPERRARARALIDRARATLALRHRETDPVTYADPADVTLFDLGRGIEIALFGHRPEHRLPLDTYYGFVLAKNRVPLAYGGGWIFLDRCEIGVNVFETFRGGESAHAFATLLRLYRWYFRVARFTVDPYQIGADNPEAIRSGAVWFYYRLGFRPRDPAIHALAEREWGRLHDGSGHRTTTRTLKRLASSPLEFVVVPGSAATFEPAALSLAVTRWIGTRFGGERDAARAFSIERVCRALGTGARSRWPEAERRAFEDLCPLAAPLPDIEHWSRADKRAAERVFRAKGGLRERRFALLLQRHRTLRAAWARFVDS